MPPAIIMTPILVQMSINVKTQATICCYKGCLRHSAIKYVGLRVLEV